MKNARALVILSLSFLNASAALISPLNSWAAGKKPTPITSGPELAHPAYKIIVRPVQTRSFHLPNRVEVNLGPDLDAILNSVITAQTGFLPSDPQTDPDQNCDRRLELRPAVTTLEMSVVQVGLHFGYSPSGSLSGIGNVNLNADLAVKIGTIAMDFSLWECVHNQCASISATTASHLTANVNLNLTVNFGVIGTGANFVYNTQLESALRSIMNKGMTNLASSARLNELDWRANVRLVENDGKTILFDQGSHSRIGVNQAFVVYATAESTGACDVFKPIAYVHTVQVDPVSAYAVVDQVLDPNTPIQSGNVVMARNSLDAATVLLKP